jgi:hypothetical protein
VIRSDGLGAPTTDWPFHAIGAAVILIGVAVIALGALPGGLNVIAAGAWIVAHPWLRARWYRTGYADGYVDGRSEPRPPSKALDGGYRPPSVTCPRCCRTSYNENDIRAGYCGNCHAWTSPPRESIGERR